MKNSTILMRDPMAVRLAKDRAQKEHRTFANAAAVTIIEALGPSKRKHTTSNTMMQGEKPIQDSLANDNGAAANQE
jgi:hypothetical protein